ncbi:MAG TPA: PAS domain-containing protein, partial [Pseudobdellovibrionaceae bacterium]|nr:PAS domain-containing protein [Pseudobdellovibrionaceae bacterium]
MSFPTELFDSLLEPCFVLNGDQKVVYCNETGALMAGVSARKAQRKTFAELFSFSDPVEWMGQLSQVTSAAPYKETHFTSAEGNEGKVQLTCQPLPVSEGTEPLWIVFVRDVTLEERLQKKYRAELEQTERYSKNLEKMVEERTSEIRELNKLMGALLDSLSQGFFVFDKNGICHDFSSKSCADVLEGLPNKRPVWDVLKLPPNRVEGFQKWLFTLFADMLPFEDLAPLGPPSYPHSEGKSIKLDYFPLKGETGVEGVVVVASDVTSLVEAQQQAETERQNALMILNLLNKKQQIARFIRETKDTFTELKTSLAQDPAAWDGDAIFRSLHTIKGGCASFNVMKAAHAAHEAENRLASWNENPSSENALRLRESAVEVQNSFGDFLEETKKILG